MATVFNVRGHDVVVADPVVTGLFELVQSRLARTPLPILIHGETGAGKEIVAAAVHEWSSRKDNPMICVNCAALPDSLVESALYGHKKGAFTGADFDKRGLVRSADRGTLFLDEIGELSEHAQSKLLRFLENKTVRPVGADEEVPVDVRIVAATHRNIRKEVEAGRFRKDLYFRLRGATIKLPPLRERPEDIVALTKKFLADTSERVQAPPKTLAPSFIAQLQAYHWPGNVRELESAMSYLGVITPDIELRAAHFELWCDASVDLLLDSVNVPTRAQTADITFKPIAVEIADLERDRMRRALVATEGRRNEAAALIAMPLRTFSTKLKLYELDQLSFPRRNQA